MPTAFVKRALVQGDMAHEGAKLAPKGFTIEERSTDESGKTKVTGYFNCVAKGEVMEAIEAAQWSEVSLVTELRFNRDTKYLQLEVVKVIPVEA
jgi:hypothetical protein